MLSTEQGVYVAESVVSKNVKQAKGRFRLYDTDDSMVIPCEFIAEMHKGILFLILTIGYGFRTKMVLINQLSTQIILQEEMHSVERFLVVVKKILQDRQKNLASPNF